MAKYDPLHEHLKDVPSDRREIRLAFSLIESILGAGLPASARIYQAWWANETVGSHVQARAWMDAGWRVEAISLEAEWVLFCR